MRELGKPKVSKNGEPNGEREPNVNHSSFYQTERVSELTREFFSAIIQLLLTYDKHLINTNRSLDKVENLNYTRLSSI